MSLADDILDEVKRESGLTETEIAVRIFRKCSLLDPLMLGWKSDSAICKRDKAAAPK